jgi:hypothetical protein
MPDFSTIMQAPDVRALVQENILERAFHDALFPRLMFRGEAVPQLWPQNVGDTMVFTGVGLIKPTMKPTVPGQDPTPSSFSYEQWTAQLQQLSGTIDTHMPTSIAAIASLFYRNAQQLGMSAGMTLNRIVRNRLYNAGLSGHTVASATSTTTTLKVKRLNGFTRARRPDLPNGAPVKYETVSANNPLKIKLFDNGAEVANTVVGYTPDTAGDEIGPGSLTLGTACTSVALRAYVIADDRTSLVRVGGGFKVDDVGASDLFQLQDIRTAVARFWQQNVPEQPDGRFHCHMDPTSMTQVFNDDETQRMLTSLPDYFMYRQFSIGELLGCAFFRNSECPLPETVSPYDGTTFSDDDYFAGELYNNGATTGVKVHRPLFLAQGAIFEYYQDLAALLTEAGITGKVAEPRISNNGIEVFTDRIQLIIRAPLNRLQDSVSTSWKFIGDWPVRADGAVGDAARYKRVLVVEHGE